MKNKYKFICPECSEILEKNCLRCDFENCQDLFMVSVVKDVKFQKTWKIKIIFIPLQAKGIGRYQI